ncbi:MAG: RNA-directed DNA polymerase, partial [Oligoflexia bacterium]|nr:RNA-directed DNA polymerase [Oligoflexia bacterium]
MQQKLSDLEDLSDIAKLLSTTPQKIGFILYRSPNIRESQYTEYTIPKKTGGQRTIAAPDKALLILQSRLNRILQKAYISRPSAHAFVEDRSIKTNALVHQRRRFVL